MHDYLTRQWENIATNLLASVIFAFATGAIAWLAPLPPIPVPAWLFVFLLAFVCCWWWVGRKPRKLKPVVDQTFGVEPIILDGKNFVKCKFNGSELIFSGRTNFSLQDCTISTQYFTFKGDAATVMHQLSIMYKTKEFKQLIDNTLNKA
jgi:FtsH-binding integral membrane protein